MIAHSKYLSLRIKLDDIVIDKDYEKKVLENIRYCRKLNGKHFRVIFWNKNLSQKECKDFVKRNEHLLFEVNTKITKRFEYVWFLINTIEDKSTWRYSYNGDVIEGIAQYLKLTKFIRKRENEDSNRR